MGIPDWVSVAIAVIVAISFYDPIKKFLIQLTDKYLFQKKEDEVFPEEKNFIEAHAGRWLPHLGRALAQAGDEVYAPIGELLAAAADDLAARLP